MIFLQRASYYKDAIGRPVKQARSGRPIWGIPQPCLLSKDKVLIIAFAVCAAFLFGDHLAFTANFQPTLVLSIMVGKLIGGLCGFALAYWLSVPKALELESREPSAITENAPP